MGKNTLEAELRQAESYEQWRDIALRLDEKTGLDYWKEIDRSKLYDYESIRQRLDRMRELRAKDDDEGLLFALNEGVHGNMGGMGRMSLYTKSYFGTKQLIADFIDEMVDALQYLADQATPSIPFDEKLDFYQRASHCAGRSALMLSGSGSLFYFHLGVVKALWEQNILPPILSGASGGALVSALVGTHTNDELRKIFRPEHIRFEVEKEAGVLSRLSPFQSEPISANAIRQMFERLIPDLTFREAYERTGLHINVSVSPAEKHQSSRLLNAIASPNVLIREALMASSAFPGIFPPVTLMARNKKGERQAYLPGRKWIDGSVSDDLPIRRVARVYGVNHFIVSQTNPVALPFISENKEATGFEVVRKAARTCTRETLLAATKLVSGPRQRGPGLAHLFRLTSSVLAQTYTGDINILPPKRLHNPLRLLSTRSTEEIISMIADGERACWPKIETVRLQTRISRTLDLILHRYEQELLIKASPSLQTRRDRKNTTLAGV